MRLVWLLGAPLVAVALSACGEREPHPYPESARVRFEASCPSASAVCVCTWQEITTTVPHDDYEAALLRFRETGLMEPRISRARAKCIERHSE
ncbi:MAG: hypothetical protein H7124_18285 [Phycisphaerales bacterium]|nr:hypothetical protein [Hyphomonadaceae bacterium]